MRTRSLFTTLMAAGLASLLAGPAASAFTPPRAVQNAGLGIRLLDAPVDRRNDPRARIYIIDHVKPGTSITRRVQVSDNTSGPLHAAVYAGGADIDHGAFRPAARGTPSELGQWTTATPTSVVLRAHKTANVSITIKVPADASPGERYGVIWAELPPSKGSTVTEVNRVGVRIYLSVGPGGEPASDFTVDSLQATRRADGVPVVVAQIHNTGGRALDMNGTLSLSHGPAGLSAGPFPATLGTSLVPGQTEPVTVPLDQAIRGGPWSAVLEVRSGLLIRKATAQLTFPDKGGSAGDPVQASTVPLHKDHTVRLVAVIMASLLLLLLLALALREWLRRQRAVQE